MKKNTIYSAPAGINCMRQCNHPNADIIHNAIDACGDECATVLTTGEGGNDKGS